jgi:mRNA interferase RelE/StbE
MFNIIFEKRALEDLNKLEREIKERIWNKLQQCKEDPFRFLEHLEEIEGFKLRVGDYRIIVDVDNFSKIIKVLKLGHRKNIYEN